MPAEMEDLYWNLSALEDKQQGPQDTCMVVTDLPPDPQTFSVGSQGSTSPQSLTSTVHAATSLLLDQLAAPHPLTI